MGGLQDSPRRRVLTARPVVPSVAIVVTFFGQAPLWMPAFLLSCRANADVHWILYTDVDLGTDVPPNVVVKPTTLRELSQQASDALQFSVPLRRLRKLCDLKITYGVIFENDLRPFDFWGCSDLDIVWGSFRSFATDASLREHDVFSSRRHKLSGHCTLYRNRPGTNRLFERIPDYANLLGTSHYEHLDERELTKYIEPDVRVRWDEELTTRPGDLKSLGDESLSWRDGRTFDATGREVMYIHFHKWKEGMADINFGPGDRPSAFSISRRGFFS